MPKNVFSVPIFFIVFRETLEAAIIVSVLLGLAEQIVHDDPSRVSGSGGARMRPQAVTTTDTVLPALAEDRDAHTRGSDSKDESKDESGSGSGSGSHSLRPEASPIGDDADAGDEISKKRLIRKLRIQIFAGASLGLFLALAIGAAFIAVWFTQASNLWAKSEELWEGIFELIASVMIFVMGVTMLKMDRAKAKWRLKLQRAFNGSTRSSGEGKTGKWVLFILPLITVLREGMEAVVFVGGVSLGQPATSIPIATIVGLVCGLIIGFLIYQFASRTTLTLFLTLTTSLLLLIGSGLFSRSISAFQEHAFNLLLGADVDDAGAAGDGPGSYRVQGNVWHLDCCNPDNNIDGQGWSVFNAILGWTNNATVGSVLGYVGYWVAVVVVLVGMKYREGRTKLFGYESAAGKRRRVRREEKQVMRETEKTNGTTQSQSQGGVVAA